jgi:hypothetical protein
VPDAAPTFDGNSTDTLELIPSWSHGEVEDFGSTTLATKVALLRSDFGIISIAVRPESGFAVVGINNEATGEFFLETSTDGMEWAVAGVSGSATGAGMRPPAATELSVITAAGAPTQFYRMR